MVQTMQQTVTMPYNRLHIYHIIIYLQIYNITSFPSIAYYLKYFLGYYVKYFIQKLQKLHLHPYINLPVL